MQLLKRTRFVAALAVPAILLLGAARPIQDKEVKPTFDPGADAKAAVSEATAFALKKHKRVLLVWGHDAGGEHVKLVETLRKAREPWPFYYEYQIVPVHVGANGADNAELAKTLGVEKLTPDPFMTILDAKGKPLANRDASAFRDGKGWSTEKLAELLVEFAVEPEDAEKILEAMVERAAKENKRLLVHLGAPW